MNTVGKKFVSVILAGMITISACNTGTIVMAATNDESAFKFPDVYDSQYLKVESEAVINAKVDALIKTMTQEEKFGLLGGNGTGSNGEAGTLPGVPRLGVPEAKMYDGPAGVLSLYDTTNPPIEQMLAATWDPNKIHTSQYNEGIMTGYRWYDNMNIEPQYDFGYGLSYTKFKYSNLKVSENSQKGYDVTFNVTNTGSVTGSEVAQLYLGAAQVPNGIQMAKKQLAGYVRVEDLKPNETRTVSSTIENRSLCYWNTNSALVTRDDGTQDKWTLAAGERSLAVGSASNDETSLVKTINVKSTMALSGTTVPASDNSGSDSSSHHHSGGSGNSSTATSTDIGTTTNTGASKTGSTIITSYGTFVTDTTTDVRVKGGYTMKLTSNEGKAPKVILGTPGVFDVQLVTTNGKDYFVKLIPIGKVGTQTGVYLDGVKLFAATVETPVSTSTVKSDTTRPFKVKKGASYVMKLTASSRPTLISGTPSAFRVEFVKVSGSDYYFKIIPTGKTGVSCGLYVNSGKTPVTVATVA